MEKEYDFLDAFCPWRPTQLGRARLKIIDILNMGVDGLCEFNSVGRAQHDLVISKEIE